MEAKRKMRAGLYGRQSHGKQRSIDEQITECTRDAEAEGYEVVATYEDTTSASRHARKARPDHARLLADLEAGNIDVVVVWETSRADRRLTQWSELLDWCRDNQVLIRVTDDGETYDVSKPKHWKRLATDGVSNAYSSEETRQRNLRTARLSAEAGRPNGPVPYGYTRTYDAKTRELIEQSVVPDEATIVEEVFRRVAKGEPIKVLAEEMQGRGIASPSGNGWTPNGVREIARNPVYIGQRRHEPKAGGVAELHSAIWPAIVDEERFWRCQRVLDDRAEKFWRPARMQHVLTGVPVCDACGGVYAGSVSTKHPSGRRYGCRVGGCGYIDADELETLVLAYVLGRLARKDVYSQLRRAGADADKELGAARAAAEKLRRRLDEWRDSAVRGETTPATMAKIEKDLTTQIVAADRKADRAGIPPAVRELADAGDELPERWAAMPLAARRDVVGALVDVVVVKGRRGVKLPIGDRVAITWKGMK